MGEVTITRHGQANSGARNEEEYDRLSDLGHQQAAWLGEYLSQTQTYDRVISGGLRRQIETAQGLNTFGAPHQIDERLNELNYFALSDSLSDMHGVPFPDSPATFAAHVPQILSHWAAEETPPHIESYTDFRTRIFSAIEDACAMEGRTLLVSSTGVIASLTAIALGLEINNKAKMFLFVPHTSLHRFAFHDVAGTPELHLTQYGATPHLDLPERSHAKTMV
ncbi:histidine phosphatase family protein [Nereida sp. MMG025]|uniref:histidine phosphatase family protein n=1 Tax=Nereida sp. MMG025 TaxID=2909981 RepID=UPI001F403AB2|nr:histidine phosphatase family protein [Nereida sp. MMG025]MCF6444863.1 histidine phosphatase family protein [Nereida sp. MMG025]